MSGRGRLAWLPGAAAGLTAAMLLSELRLSRGLPASERWRSLAVAARGPTRLGISFRPHVAEAMGLDPRAALSALLAYPFELVRLGACWSRIEPRPGTWDAAELDRQVEAARRAGKRIILCVGAVKNFGYPEFFVPAHRLARPLPEGALISVAANGALSEAAAEFVLRVVERYRDCAEIEAWQVEHEAVDPLGMEHSWRLAVGFVEREIAAVRSADPARPVLLNGFLPASLGARAFQWWRTRDQGDSTALALRRADIVGVDLYPRSALFEFAGTTAYLDGAGRPWQARRRRSLFAAARRMGRRLMVTEGQAEPWEAVTTPPTPRARHFFSCPPERIIANYNLCLASAREAGASLEAYLFWGAEYWLLRRRAGDPQYLGAFARILEEG